MTEFDNLERKKVELTERVRQGQRMMRVFMRQMIAQQKEVADAEKRLSVISRRMDVMVDRESRALGELLEFAPSTDEPDQEVMGLEDDFFLFDDPALLDYGLPTLGDVPSDGETTQGGPSSSPGGQQVKGSSLVPMCFLLRHILTI